MRTVTAAGLAKEAQTSREPPQCVPLYDSLHSWAAATSTPTLLTTRTQPTDRLVTTLRKAINGDSESTK